MSNGSSRSSGLGGKVILDGKNETSWAARFLEGKLAPANAAPGRAYLHGRRRRGAIVHEFLLYRMGLTGDDAGIRGPREDHPFRVRRRPDQQLDLVGMMTFGANALSEKESKTLKSALKRLAFLVRLLPIPVEERAALRKVFDRLTTTTTSKGTTYSQDFKIVGVVREQNDDDEKPGPFGNWSRQDAESFCQTQPCARVLPEGPRARRSRLWLRGRHRRSGRPREGSGKTHRRARVQRVFARAVYRNVRLNVLMITFATAFVAIVALIVAAVGITNTMIMSVLERSHEIGVMKALGARERHILLIFLMEGSRDRHRRQPDRADALAWLASIPGDSIAKSIMEPQTQTPVKGTLFLFPPWLVAGRASSWSS